MELQDTYATQDEIPEDSVRFYVEKDGSWHLDLQGALDRAAADASSSDSGGEGDPKRKLDEFRATNRRQQQELEDLKREHGRTLAKFEGIDLEAYKRAEEMIKRVQADEEKELLKAGQLDEVVKRRSEAAIAQKQQELEAKTTAYDDLLVSHNDLRGRFAKREARSTIHSVISDQGLNIKKGAVDTLNLQVEQDWRVDDKGNPVAREGLYGEDGSPIKPNEYVARELVNKRSFLFEGAKGGGAEGSDAMPPADGKIRIPKNDAAMKAKYVKELATGKAMLV